MKINERTINCPLIKTHYYPGKLLQASDLINDQEYVNRKLELLNRVFHGWGILEGLQVEAMPEGRLRIRKGSALDSRGRILFVPQEQIINLSHIVGQEDEISREEEISQGEQELILGIQYAERVYEEEQSLLEAKGQYRPARIEETASIKGYTVNEWKAWKEHCEEQENLFLQTCCLYEDEKTRLTLEVPYIVPGDSIFRIRLKVQSLQKGNLLGWRGVIRLQGGRFLHSGHSYQIFERKEAKSDPNLGEEWDIYTEEHRNLPILLEVERLEILTQNTGPRRAESIQLSIETSESCKKLLTKRGLTDTTTECCPEDWIPLAKIRVKRSKDGQYRLESMETAGIRFSVQYPREEALWGRMLAENNIIDIRFRYLLKMQEPLPLPKQMPPQNPRMPQGNQPKGKKVRRGVAVIPVPKGYKRGRILFSEEIFHGFPGEEVFVQWGRIYEERNYAYWEQTEKKHSVIFGVEDLFEEAAGSGWMIEEQAVKQNVNAGTFQIALTLQKIRHRPQNKEIAIAWMVYQIT